MKSNHPLIFVHEQTLLLELIENFWEISLLEFISKWHVLKQLCIKKTGFCLSPSATVLSDSEVRSGQFSLLYKKMALITGNQV